MKNIMKCLAFLMIVGTGMLCGLGVSYGQITSGQLAPPFSLEDLKGKKYDLSQMQDRVRKGC